MSIQDDIAAYQAQQPLDINADILAYQQQQQQPLTNPDAVPENQTLSESQFHQAPEEVVKQEPDFMKKLDLINTGVHRGVTNFTLALMSKLPLSDEWQKKIKSYNTEIGTEQQHNKDTYSGYYSHVGEAAGEMLITLPAGGALGGVIKGAKVVGGVLPTGLKTIGKYGSGSLLGAEVLAAVESQKYDPENPGQLINKKKVDEVLSNPLAYAFPAAATKLSVWSDAANKLGAAKERFPNSMARNVKESGITQKMSIYYLIYL